EIVRIGLRPLDPALRAIDPELQPVLVAGRHLARPDHALGAALEAQQYVGVIVEQAPLHEGIEIGSERIELETADEAGEIVGMRADVAGRAANARLLRVYAPRRLLLAARLEIG